MQKTYHFFTDFQWQVIESLFSQRRKSKWDLIKIGEGICYLTKTGCQRRLLPTVYAPWQTVYWYFRKWTLDGIIEIAHQTLRKKLRKKKAKMNQPALALLIVQA
jgi:putative transposase